MSYEIRELRGALFVMFGWLLGVPAIGLALAFADPTGGGHTSMMWFFVSCVIGFIGAVIHIIRFVLNHRRS